MRMPARVSSCLAALALVATTAPLTGAPVQAPQKIKAGRAAGGFDLTVDSILRGPKLVEKQKVNPRRIGVYGGSYGGFITLMAMFTTPDLFAAAAAPRPVTDWTHDNHDYTSNILNDPQAHAEAYRQRSPIYFADGLRGALLICHGMVDTNVLFQDSVRLVERRSNCARTTGRWRRSRSRTTGSRTT